MTPACPTSGAVISGAVRFCRVCGESLIETHPGTPTIAKLAQRTLVASREDHLTYETYESGLHKQRTTDADDGRGTDAIDPQSESSGANICPCADGTHPSPGVEHVPTTPAVASQAPTFERLTADDGETKDGPAEADVEESADAPLSAQARTAIGTPDRLPPGALDERWAPTPPGSSTRASGQHRRRCPDCGASMASSARFCGQCGTTTEPETMNPGQQTCPDCRSPAAASTRFCRQCGTQLTPQRDTDTSEHPHRICRVCGVPTTGEAQCEWCTRAIERLAG